MRIEEGGPPARDGRAPRAHDEPLLGAAGSARRAPSYAARARAWRAALGVSALVGASVLASRAAPRGGGAPPLAASAALGPVPDWPFETVQHPLAVTAEWGAVSRPYPTGAWWTNLAVADAYQKPGNQPSVMLPYAVRNQNGRGMEVSYGPTRRTVTALFEGDYFGADLVVGTARSAALPASYSHRVAAVSPLTLAVQFSEQGGGEAFVARLARGAPWVVTEWAGATPSVGSDFVLLSVKAIGARPERPPDAPAPAEPAAPAVEEAPVAAVEPLCSAHANCAVLAASVADGLCCPLTANGIMLECCDAPRPPPPKPPTPTPAPSRADDAESNGDVVGPSDLFVLKLQTGQTWLLAFDSPVALSWYTNPARVEVASSYHGTMRLAFAHDLDSLRSLAACAHGPYAVGSAVRVEADDAAVRPATQPPRAAAGARARAAHAAGRAPPVGAAADAAAGAAAGATLVFEWEVAGDPDGTGELVTLALPHHIAALALGSVWRDGPHFDTIKGTLTPIRGTRWSVRERFAPMGWNSPRAPARELVSTIKSSLQLDLAQPLVLRPDAKDLYGFGKQASRLARLALIADELGDSTSLQAAAAALTSALDPWLSATNPAPWPTAQAGTGALVYDGTYGGLVTRVGLSDPAADFGNGRYNDHHFQIGYMLYAAAVACRYDPQFCDVHRVAIGAIARDVAMPPDDALAHLFPVARCKDLYDGHSWASGLFQMADGKSQESSSEAVNAYYGAALVGEALGDEALRSWAQLLLAMEIRSAQWYWHVPSASPIYDPSFAATNRMVGVVGATDANAATWFGANLEYVHGINIMPVTPVTEALLPASYVAEQYAQLATRHGRMEAAWAGFAVAAHAIVDPAKALLEVAELNAFDNGNSRTNMLHWVATRPAPPTALLLALATVRSPSAVPRA